jgi:hypothetical protein
MDLPQLKKKTRDADRQNLPNTSSAPGRGFRSAWRFFHLAEESHSTRNRSG